MTKRKTFHYPFNSNLVLSILNTIYAIFLGLLFTFCVQLKVNDSDGNVKEISIMVSSANIFPVVILALYFLFDWLTTNVTIPLKEGFNNLLLIIFIILVVFLGLMVALAFDPNPFPLYWSFGSYAVIVTIWDVLLSKIPDFRGSVIFSLLIYTTVIARFSIGLFMLFFVWFIFFFRPEDYREILDQQTMILLLTIYLIVKFIRYYVYVFCQNTKEELKNNNPQLNDK